MSIVKKRMTRDGGAPERDFQTDRTRVHRNPSIEITGLRREHGGEISQRRPSRQFGISESICQVARCIDMTR